MQERILGNLILNGEDYIFAGNLFIYGNVTIENGSLIVSGKLSIGDDVTVIGGDIVCGQLLVSADISITDGDIIVYGDFNAHDIHSDGNIEVAGNMDVCNVECLNYLIAGSNYSCDINAIQDIYIWYENSSRSLKARDIFIDSDSNSNNCSITSKSFYCSGEIMECSYISVG